MTPIYQRSKKQLSILPSFIQLLSSLIRANPCPFIAQWGNGLNSQHSNTSLIVERLLSQKITLFPYIRKREWNVYLYTLQFAIKNSPQQILQGNLELSTKY